MEIIVGNRGSGKTRRLVEWAESGHAQGINRIIVVATEVEAHYLRGRSRLPSASVISMGAVLRGGQFGRRPGAEYAFDNIDLILGNLVYGGSVKQVTATGNDVVLQGGVEE